MQEARVYSHGGPIRHGDFTLALTRRVKAEVSAPPATAALRGAAMLATVRASSTTWSRGVAEVLRGCYGTNWRKVSSPSVSPWSS
eukprot:911808-Prorocentrum_minimum.AAC.2